MSELQINLRREFPYLLNRLGLLGSVIEVGVYEGEYGHWFRCAWKGKLYILVDPWQHLPGYRDPANAPNDICEQRFEKTHEVFSVFNPSRYQIVRGTSEQAHHLFGDNTIDMVYIDADHDYAPVSNDIRWWWPKIKKGGILSGHDYTEGWGVKDAVDHFVDPQKLKLHVTTEVHSPSWYVFKP